MKNLDHSKYTDQVGRKKVLLMRKILLTVTAIILAVVHALFPEKIDVITIALLGVSALPWLYPIFKSVDIPWLGKIEFPELEEAEKRIVDSGLVPPEGDIKPMQKHVYAFQAVSGDDPNLVLSGLQVEIESRLMELAEFRGIDVRKPGIPSLTGPLEESCALSRSEAQAIRKLLPLLNKATHGVSVDKSALDWAMDFGPRILGALEDRLGQSTIPDLIEGWKRRDGAAVAEIGTKLSRSFINSPESFLSIMNKHPDELEAWIKDLEHHTFTIFESGSELDDELYLAYYEKFKMLMIDAAESCKRTQYGDLALKIKDAVSNVEIRRIW